MTHLFADGGRIVKSTRTDYSEHLERDDMAQVVKNMMKEQHKAMFVALRSGELDGLIGFESEAVQASASQPDAAPTTQASPSASESRIAAAAKEEAGPESAKGVHKVAEPVEEKAYAASRPASIFSVPPPKSSSIFGEVGIDEKSLDDAILSYLAEDEDEKDGSSG